MAIGTKSNIRPRFTVEIEGAPGFENLPTMPTLMVHPHGGERYSESTAQMVELIAQGWSLADENGEPKAGLAAKVYDQAQDDNYYLEVMKFRHDRRNERLMAAAAKARAKKKAKDDADRGLAEIAQAHNRNQNAQAIATRQIDVENHNAQADLEDQYKEAVQAGIQPQETPGETITIEKPSVGKKKGK